MYVAGRAAARWLIEEGVETTAAGAAMLLVTADELEPAR
jgi:hypothetical protein